MLIDLLLLNVATCYIVDVSGVMDSIKEAVWKYAFKSTKEYTGFNAKPFDCSKCMCFWVTLIFCLFHATGLILSLFLAALMSLFSESITLTLLLIRDKINDRLNMG